MGRNTTEALRWYYPKYRLIRVVCGGSGYCLGRFVSMESILIFDVSGLTTTLFGLGGNSVVILADPIVPLVEVSSAGFAVMAPGVLQEAIINNTQIYTATFIAIFF
jgi:hypothetical protein